MAEYKVRDILYQYVLEQNSYPQQLNQDFIIRNIYPAKNQYQLRGLRDNQYYYYSKEVLDGLFRHRKQC